MPRKGNMLDNSSTLNGELPLAIVNDWTTESSLAPLQRGDQHTSPVTHASLKKKEVPTAEEFLKSILADIDDNTDEADNQFPPPTPNQIMFADSLGVEMNDFPSSK